YTAVLLLLIVLRILMGQVRWAGSANLHMLMEFTAASLALFVGALALVRYYTKKSSAYLYIGCGFIGAGLLDAYHAMRSVSLNELLVPTAVSLDMWQWNPSSTFLGIFIAG